MNKDIMKIINNRASCRNFKDEKISDEVVDKLLDAACKSPSGGGFQNYSIIKITDQKIKDELVPLCRDQKFISKAPVSLVFCIDFRRIKIIQEIEPFPFEENNKFMNFWMSILDTAISAQTLTLAAESYGLKSVYIGNIINNIDKVSDLLNLPDYVLPSIMLTLGYPKQVPKPTNRYSKELIVHENIYTDYSTDILIDEYKGKYSNWKLQPKDKFIDLIYKTSKKLEDEEFAEKCIEYIKEKNMLSPYQYWFGCYYLDDDFMSLEGYVDFMREKGFKWI